MNINKKVDIFIVGAPKAGTTSLYHYLDQHSDIFMSSRKEIDYFSNNDLLNEKLYYDTDIVDNLEDYHSFFNGSNTNQILGEASVSYLFYPKVANKIKQYNQNAKIIIMLRDPFERAFSHYLMDFRLGLVSESFESIFSSKTGIYFQQYFQLGNYSKQVNNYFRVFGKENVHIIWYHDFLKKTEDETNKVFDFLGLSHPHFLNVRKKHNVGLMPNNQFVRFIYSIFWLRRFFRMFFPTAFVRIIKSFLFLSKKPVLEESIKKRVYSYYLKDIIDLEGLLEVNLGVWKK